MEKEQLNLMRKEYASFLNAELDVDKSMIKESKKETITESRTEVTGNKEQKTVQVEEGNDNIVDIRKLAGLAK